MKKIIKSFLAKRGFALKSNYSILVNRRQLRVFSYLAVLYSKIKDVPGSVVECGIGLGRTFLYLSFLIEGENKKRHLYGFDSFLGFPEPTAEDISSRNPKKGEWAVISPEDLKKIIIEAGFSEDWYTKQVHVIPGFFDKTLSSYSGGPIAFLHIDVDLYSSYKTVLDILYPQVVSGGIVLFDEYNEDKWPGATKAVNDFLETHKEELLREPVSGKHYFIKK